MKSTFIKTAVGALALCSAMVTGPVFANSISFDKSWKEQGLLRLFGNEYALKGRSLGVSSDGTVSVIWRPVDAGLRQAKRASWNWAVQEGVAPTDLTRKGGDDRNLALYFVFLDPQSADNLSRTSARKLLRNPNTRALVYVWGGDHARGDLLRSPYSAGLRTKIMRTNAQGSFSENVDLAADYRRAFDGEAGVLVGLAITADSDDTKGRIRATLSDLTLK
ncbi:DUF3047 domain-containing protein [Primorskyibacter sp. S187A]|uniref:DUF3047 domain-containing protein n=1 Tax=Primorskyibacter sp. S187A TaxID=3415130 RepID=UPI003C7E4C16